MQMKNSKKLGPVEPSECIIGFFDEASPQTSSNTVRMWSFRKPVIIKNATKFRANTFGFYAYNGKSVVNIYINSKQGSAMKFLEEIRHNNPFTHIIVILDNFPAHRTKDVAITAEILDIELVFLPPYSPKINPIELIWKSIKKVVSRTFMKSEEMFIEMIKTNFIAFSKSKSFCKKWVDVFVNA